MSKETKEEKRDCAFQYAKIHGSMFRRTEIVCDKSELTLTEAKELWNQYYSDFAKHIKDGDDTAEMAIWINMPDPHSYGETLYHISTDAESDGKDIWVTTKQYFPRNIKTLVIN